jgi:hypothetical protein
MKGTSDTEYYDEDGNVITTGLPAGYKVHPAFQAMTTTEDFETNSLGKWDEELEGIWVAKYEASREISTNNWATYSNGGNSNTLTTNAGNGDSTLSRVVSKPSVISWRDIAQSNIYLNSLNMHAGLNSHEMKNSEWGAVAYLAHSAYGRNGNEVAVNQCEGNYTGAGPGEGTSTIYNDTYEYEEGTFENTYAWNTTQGKLASTTGNIYGVYDLSGGAWEYIAAYINNGNDSITENGGLLVTTTNMKTKQVYESTVNDGSDAQTEDYELAASVYGDAVYETSTSASDENSWYNDYSDYPCDSSPFFRRGRRYNGTDSSGIFSFYGSHGYDSSSYGFRPVLCISSNT